MIGLIAGYYRGWTDSLLTRAMDVMLAFPVLLLAIGLGVACADGCLSGAIQPGLTVVVTVIALSLWPYMARIVRGQVLSLREKEFVEAAQVPGRLQHAASSSARSSPTSSRRSSSTGRS